MTDLLNDISVVVPVYNSEATLPLLIERLESTLRVCAHAFEVILVNDGSSDNTWHIVRELSARCSFVRGLNLMRNYGQHNALLAGIRVARYQVTVTLDDDLQNPPEEIPKLLKELAQGYDAVYGTPHRAQHGLWRDLASQMTKLALRGSMGVETASKVSTFRAFRTQLRDAFANYRAPFVSIDVLLTWGSTNFSAVTVRHDPRPAGESHYSFRKLITQALNMMTGFSTLPLQLASLVGFSFMLFGVGVLIYVVGRYLMEGGSVPGFPFMASIIAIFSGAQLFALGIIGEYLARMHFQGMGRPASLIRDSVNFEN